MHYLLQLVTTLLPIKTILGESDLPPVGNDFVVTSRGTFVVTARNANVVAKSY